jgi:heme exporter protein B
MTLWRQSKEVMRVDLLVEQRIGDAFRIVLPFAVVAMMIFSLAIPASFTDVGEVGTAVFWAVAVLYGMQVALRTSVSGTEQRRDISMLLGLDPAARFIGRSMAAALLLVGFMAVLLVAMVLLFDPDLPSGWFGPTALAILLAGGGLAMLATLAGEVASGLRNQSALASLLIAPLVIPIVVGASQALESTARNDGILIWILLLITTDLALLVAGVGLSRPLEEASR